jgi:hypothetical protein
MSNILVQNIKHTNNTTAIEINSSAQMAVKSDGGATTTSLQQGLAKAWISLNGTGTIATRGSFNVASIADEGTGAYQTNLTSATADANYAVTGSAGDTGTASGCWHTTGFNANSYNTSNTTSSFHQQIYYATSNVADVSYVYASLNGDLA